MHLDLTLLSLPGIPGGHSFERIRKASFVLFYLWLHAATWLHGRRLNSWVSFVFQGYGKLRQKRGGLPGSELICPLEKLAWKPGEPSALIQASITPVAALYQGVGVDKYSFTKKVFYGQPAAVSPRRRNEHGRLVFDE
jgi:hypothetical protein